MMGSPDTPSQTQRRRQTVEEHRASFRRAQEFGQQLTENAQLLETGSGGELLKAVQKVNELYDADNQYEAGMDLMVTDAKNLSFIAGIAASRADKVRLEASQINVDDFIDKVLARYPNEEQEVDWEALGKRALMCLRKVPTLDFMFGVLKMPKKEKKQARAHQKLVRQGNQVKPKEQTVEQLKQTSSTETTRLVKATFTALNRATNKGQNAIPFFSFVINPDPQRGFGQTVENIFYATFLIADNKVHVFHDKDHELMINVESQGYAGDEDVDEEGKVRKLGKHQDIMSLEYEQWKELIELYDVKTSLIPNRPPVEGYLQ